MERFDHTALVEEKFTQFPYFNVSLNEVSFSLSLLLHLKPSQYIDVSLNEAKESCEARSSSALSL